MFCFKGQKEREHLHFASAIPIHCLVPKRAPPNVRSKLNAAEIRAR